MIQKLKTRFIGDKNFYRKLLVLVFPIIIQQGITCFVSLVDNVMVGRLGTESMSGVAIVNQLLYVFNLAIFGGVSGASIYGAQFFGKGDHDGVRSAFRFKIIFSVVVTVVAAVGLTIWKEPLISLFLTESESGGNIAYTLSEAKDYLMVMLFGMIPFAFSQTYASTLRETGETFSPMAASCIAILLNLVLNYCLIFGNFGMPRLGVVGAALGTIVSRYVEALFLIVRTQIYRKKFIFIQKAFRSFYIPLDIVKKIFITGSPLIVNEILWSVGVTVINQSYSTRGLRVVAATNITSTVWNLFSIVMFAMGTAVSIIIGQLLGADRIEEAKDTDNKLLFFTVALHIIIGGIIILAAPYIPQIYNVEPEVKALTTSLLRVAGAALPIHAFAHVTYFTLRSGGKTFITFLFDSIYTWVVPLPIAFLLCRMTTLPIVTIYFCVQFIDGIKVIIGIMLLKSGIWAKRIVAE